MFYVENCNVTLGKSLGARPYSEIAPPADSAGPYLPPLNLVFPESEQTMYFLQCYLLTFEKYE